MVLHHNRNRVADWGTFLVLEIIALCLLHYEGSVRNTWVGHLAENFQVTVWGGIENLSSFFRLRSENKRLNEENAALLEEVARLKTEACGRITDSQWHSFNARFIHSSAAVSTMTFNSSHNYIILDKGSEDGILVNDGLITDCGVAGIVTSTSRHHSFAMSYLHNNVAVSAKVGLAGAAGTMRWTGVDINESVLSGLPIHCKVNPGDTVYTSGYSAIFPPDIPIGIVIAKKEKGGSTAKIKVKHLEDLSSLHYVEVVRNVDREEMDTLRKTADEE